MSIQMHFCVSVGEGISEGPAPATLVPQVGLGFGASSVGKQTAESERLLKKKVYVKVSSSYSLYVFSSQYQLFIAL